MKLFSLNLWLGLLLASAAYADGKDDQIAVIVDRASSLAEVSSADLAKYFKVQKSKAPDGTKLTLVQQAVGRPEREAVLSKIYAMNEGEYSKYFLQATFTGAVAAAPRALPSGAAVLKFVGENPGTLSYVRASEVTDAVKVVKIDGKAPGDTGYPLTIK